MGETQGDQLYTYTFEDTDRRFIYDSTWATNPDNLGRFSGGTGQCIMPIVFRSPTRIDEMCLV